MITKKNIVTRQMQYINMNKYIRYINFLIEINMFLIWNLCNYILICENFYL